MVDKQDETALADLRKNIEGNITLFSHHRAMILRLIDDALRATSQTPDAKSYDARFHENQIDQYEGSRSTPSASADPQAEAVAWTNEAQLAFLRQRDWADIPMAMWAKESSSSPIPLYAHPQPQQADRLDLGPANRSFHRALRQYPSDDAFKALYFFWNDVFAGQPQTVDQQAAERGAVIEECAKVAESHKWSEEIKAVTNGARTYGNDEACEKIAKAIRALSQSLATDNAKTWQEDH